MAIAFYNTPMDHSSDATFRAWGSALSAAIVAAGAGVTTHPGKIVPTTDTGQINWTTVTRPGVSTAAGYEIYKFTDSNAGSAPVYIKLEYGTGTSATVPQIWVTVGTGSNGSGTLTGFTSTRAIASRQTSITSAVTNYPTYVHSSEDAPLNIALKCGGSLTSTAMMFLSINRPCNADASIRADAVNITFNANTVNAQQTLRFSDGVLFGSTTTGCNVGYVPNAVTATSVAGTFSAFQCGTGYPTPYGINAFGIILTAEVALNTQDTATFYGAAAHNYVSLGTSVPNFSAQGTAGHGCFMMYEA